MFTILLSWQSCQNRPENVMNQDDMVKFLTDLHKLEGSLTVKSYTSPDSTKVNLTYYNALFKKYGISQADFDSSLVWYVHNPKKFTKIYGRVVENLTQFDKDVNNLNEKDKHQWTKMNSELYDKITQMGSKWGSYEDKLNFSGDNFTETEKLGLEFVLKRYEQQQHQCV